MRPRIESYDKVVKESDLPQKVLAQVPAEPGFDVDNLRSDNEFHVMEINFGARSGDYSTQIAFRSTIDFDADRGANHRVEKAIVRACVDYGFETFTSRVIAGNDLNRKHWPPTSSVPARLDYEKETIDRLFARRKYPGFPGVRDLNKQRVVFTMFLRFFNRLLVCIAPADELGFVAGKGNPALRL